MSVTFPLNDTEYYAKDLQMWFAGRTQGVLCTDNNLVVSVKSGMYLTVGPGHAYLMTGNPNKGGIMFYNDADTTLLIEPADSTVDRIDTVAIRYDKTQNSCDIIVHKGTPGELVEGPQRDAMAYELIIAKVHVKHGIGLLSDALIEDTRLNEAYCGLVRDNIERIPTDGFDKQFRAWLSDNQAKVNIWLTYLDSIEKKTDEKLAELQQSTRAQINVLTDQYGKDLSSLEDLTKADIKKLKDDTSNDLTIMKSDITKLQTEAEDTQRQSAAQVAATAEQQKKVSDVIVDIKARADAGEFDGKDGKDGKDGVILNIQGLLEGAHIDNDGYLCIIAPDGLEVPYTIDADGYLCMELKEESDVKNS